MRNDSDDLRVPRAFTERYPPEGTTLLDLLCSRVSPDMLRDIAACDYGLDVEANLAAINRIVSGELRSGFLEWVPNEVLELYRWSKPSAMRNLTLKDYHVARAFSCASLMLMPDEHGNRLVYSNDNFAPLIESILILGPELYEPLLRQIAGVLAEMSLEDEEYLFWAFGLWAFMSLSGSFDGDPLLREVGDWALRSHKEILPWHYDGIVAPNPTFVDICFVTVSHDKWRGLARRAMDLGDLRPEWRAFLQSVVAG